MARLVNFIDGYFRWMMAGGGWRKVIGIGGPVLVVLFVIAAIAGGSDEGTSAGGSGDSSRRSQTENTPKPSATARPPTADPVMTVYREEVTIIGGELIASFGKIATLSTDQEYTSPQAFAQWRGDYLAALITIQTQIERYRHLTPPKAYEPFHAKALEAIDLYDRATLELQAGVQDLDAGRIFAGKNLFLQGNEILNQAQALIPK